MISTNIFSQTPKKLHYVEKRLPYPIYPYLENPVGASKRFQNLFYESLVDDNAQNNGYESRHINIESCRLDGNRFIVEFIEGWSWNDGYTGPVTPGDLKYSIEAANEFGVFKPVLIDKVKIESKNIVLHLGYQYTQSIKDDILDRMRQVIVVPKAFSNELEEFAESPTGTGAFRWDETEGRKIKLYSIDGDMSLLGKPYIDEVVIEEIPLLMSHWKNMRDFEEINLLIESTRISKTDAIKDNNYTVKPYASDQVSFLIFNYDNDLFEDHEIRLAIDLVVNKPALVKGTLQGEGDVMSGPFSKKNPYYEPKVKDNGYAPDSAKKLIESILDEKTGDYFEYLGKPVHLKLIYDRGLNDEEESVILQIEKELENIGIKVTKKSLITPNYRIALKKGKFDIAFFKYQFGRRSFAHQLFASNELLRKKGYVSNNFGNYSNEKVDALVEAWLETDDRTSKQDKGKQFHAALHDDIACIFLFSQTSYAIHHKSIQPIIIPYYFFGRPHEWKIGDN